MHCYSFFENMIIVMYTWIYDKAKQTQTHFLFNSGDIEIYAKKIKIKNGSFKFQKKQDSM